MILGHFCPHEKIEATKHSLKVLLVDDLLTLHLETGAGIVWTAVSLIPISIAGVRLVEGGSWAYWLLPSPEASSGGIALGVVVAATESCLRIIEHFKSYKKRSTGLALELPRTNWLIQSGKQESNKKSKQVLRQYIPNGSIPACLCEEPKNRLEEKESLGWVVIEEKRAIIIVMSWHYWQLSCEGFKFRWFEFFKIVSEVSTLVRYGSVSGLFPRL